MRSKIHAAFDKPSINSTLLVSRTEMLIDGERVAELEAVSLARDFRVNGAPLGSPEALPVPPSRILTPVCYRQLRPKWRWFIVCWTVGVLFLRSEVARAQGLKALARPPARGGTRVMPLFPVRALETLTSCSHLQPTSPRPLIPARLYARNCGSRRRGSTSQHVPLSVMLLFWGMDSRDAQI